MWLLAGLELNPQPEALTSIRGVLYHNDSSLTNGEAAES